MNKRLLLLAFILVLITIGSCEKDDICVDGDTPLLVVGFFDVTDSTAKEVPNLSVRALELETSVDTFSNPSSQDSIGIPLRVNQEITNYIFTNNSGDANNETADTLNISYEINEKFISRACGFIATYQLDTLQPVPTTNNWILGIEIDESTVTASNQIHVKVYH